MKPHHYVSGPHPRRVGRRTRYRVALKFYRDPNRLDVTFEERMFDREAAATKYAAELQAVADARNAALAAEDSA